MKVTIESTSKLVTLVIDGQTVPARIWEGHAESGIPIHCYITRVAVNENAVLAIRSRVAGASHAERRDSSDSAKADPVRDDLPMPASALLKELDL